MSLVNDALKRARAETAEREAQRRGDPYPALPPGGPTAIAPPRRVAPILAILGVVFLIGLAAGSLTFLRNRLATTEGAGSATLSHPAPSASGDPIPTRAEVSTSAPADVVSRAPEASPAAPAAPEATTQAARAIPPSSQSLVPPRATPIETPSSRPTSPRPVGNRAPAPTPRTTEPAPADAPSSSSVRNATAADGRSLALGGIAWSETGPFALVNGRVTAAGENVEGFRLTEIQREWIRLEDGDEVIVLRLR